MNSTRLVAWDYPTEAEPKCLGYACAGARAILEARLSSLTDVLYTKAIVEGIAHLSEEAMTAARAAEVSVQAPPA